MELSTRKPLRRQKRIEYEYGNPLGLLTYRQHEVLCLIVCGATSPEIGKMLSIQVSTVEQHLRAIYQKLGATNRTEAAVLAVRNHIQLSQKEEEKIQDVLYRLREDSCVVSTLDG